MQLKPCTVCNHNKFFLREKGANNIGLYCGMCEKWQKWVGKKDIPQFKRAGFRVYPENYVPESLGVVESEPQVSPHVEPQVAPIKKDLGVVNPNGYDFGNDNTSVESQLYAKRTTLGYGFSSMEEDDFEDEVDSSQPVKQAGDVNCRTCLTGSIDLLSTSGDYSLSVHADDKVMLFTDRSKKKLFATAEINFCPSCGKSL